MTETHQRKSDIEAAPQKPVPLAVNPTPIPESIKELVHWVAWQYERRKEKWTKPLLDPKTGGKAKSTAPSTWGTFKQAWNFYTDRCLDGIGFVLAAPYAGIDLDDARDPETGGVADWALEIIRHVNSYTEVSPSGTGLKIFLRGKKPGDKCRTLYGGGEVEVYDIARYFAVTGHHLPDTPVTIEQRQEELESVYRLLFPDTGVNSCRSGLFSSFSDLEIIAKASSAANGQKFMQLWHGEAAGYGSHSEADLALCHLIAFWTGPDPARIDAIFRRSQLFRDKWDERRGPQTYGERTIQQALAGRVEFYHGGGTKSKNTSQSPGENIPGPEPCSDGASQMTEEATIKLGPLSLRPQQPRRTNSGKISVQLKVFRGEILIDQLMVSTSVSSRKETVRTLLSHLLSEAIPQVEIERALGKAIAWATKVLESGPLSDGITIQSIVMVEVPNVFKLAYRTDRGAWCESRGMEITRAEFCSFTPAWLLDAAGSALDAPRDPNGINRLALLRAIKAELEILWADLLERIPSISSADLGKDTVAGRRFRSAMIRVWTRPQTFEVSKGVEGSNGQVAARASLISRVRSRSRNCTPVPRERWREVQPAFSAWWRPFASEEGEICVLLALRWELGSQVGVDLPGVTDQSSLTGLGQRYGVLDPAPPAPERTGAIGRVAVLARDITQELLEDPTGFDGQ